MTRRWLILTAVVVVQLSRHLDVIFVMLDVLCTFH